MDFLLECIGFPPDQDLDELVALVRERGESVAWRGPGGTHLRLPLGGGLEVRLDRETDQAHWSIWPYYQVDHRLRVAVEDVREVPDSPYDAFLIGRANPEVPEVRRPGTDPGQAPDGAADGYMLSTHLCDARRLPRDLTPGRVLAVSVAGFALDVTYIGPNEGGAASEVLEDPRGARFTPLGGEHDPGGCMEVSLRVRSLRHLENPVTGVQVDLLEADAPGRPMPLFVSKWQLESDGVEEPRPGWRIEGVFVFTGRIAGGLPKPPGRVRRHFG